MDPDEALARLRQLSIDVGDDAIDNDEIAAEFADVFEGLDRWLSVPASGGVGGFLPTAWHTAQAAKGDRVFPPYAHTGQCPKKHIPLSGPCYYCS